MGRPRLLIVDDEPAVLAALELAFEDRGWDIEVAPDGEIGVLWFEKMPFDAVLVDKNLPDMDGVAVAQAIREQSDTARIIMMTGYASIDSAVATANLGIDAYIEKPFRDVFAVGDLVQQALERPRTQKARTIARSFARSMTITTVRFRKKADAAAVEVQVELPAISFGVVPVQSTVEFIGVPLRF